MSLNFSWASDFSKKWRIKVIVFLLNGVERFFGRKLFFLNRQFFLNVRFLWFFFLNDIFFTELTILLDTRTINKQNEKRWICLSLLLIHHLTPLESPPTIYHLWPYDMISIKCPETTYNRILVRYYHFILQGIIHGWSIHISILYASKTNNIIYIIQLVPSWKKYNLHSALNTCIK